MNIWRGIVAGIGVLTIIAMVWLGALISPTFHPAELGTGVVAFISIIVMGATWEET